MWGAGGGAACSHLSIYLLCQKVLLPLQELLLLQMLLLLLPLFLLIQKQLMLLHDSCLLLAAEIGGTAVSAGHGHGGRLGPHAGCLGWHRDIGRVRLLSTQIRGLESGGTGEVCKPVSPDQSTRAPPSESLAPCRGLQCSHHPGPGGDTKGMSTCPSRCSNEQPQAAH